MSFERVGAGQKAKWGLPDFLQLLYKDFITYVKAESLPPLSPFNNPPFNATAEGTEFQFTSGGAQMFRYGIFIFPSRKPDCFLEWEKSLVGERLKIRKREGMVTVEGTTS